MFAKAVQQHVPAPDHRTHKLSQPFKPHTAPLTPPPSSALNAPRRPIPASSNPLKRTASQASGSGAFDHPQRLHTGSQMQATIAAEDRVGKLHVNVLFDENDFDDDNTIDLDEEDSMTKRKNIPVTGQCTGNLHNLTPLRKVGLPRIDPTSHGLPPPPTLAPEHTPVSSTPLQWSSSPIEHHQIPGSRQHEDVALKEAPGPRRTLPWLEKFAASPQEEHTAAKEPPEYVKNIIARNAERKMARGEVAETPLSKEKDAASPYPWNKTLSAVKQEQKKLRQANKKLVKEGSGNAVLPRKKKESVARVFLSEEQRSVLDLVADRQKSVFFTGSAGTGKSVLLREIIKVVRDKYRREPDRVAVTASTGLAACNIGGVTLHSFAGIGLGKEPAPELVRKIKKNQKAKNRWLRTKVLIVDEISMVDGELFDKLEEVARSLRNNGRPFGGIQLVITGDFFQLPPVPDYGKSAKFSFDAATWNTSIEHTIGLTQVFRQKDPVFANMLNEMRIGRLTPTSIEAFRALDRPLSFQDDFQATELFPTRNEVDGANGARMRKLTGTEVEFKAMDGGSIQDLGQREKLLSNCMAPPSITLKKGAQVMLIKNIDETLVNGSVGKVVAFMDEKTFDIYHEDEDGFQAIETMDPNDEDMTRARKKLKDMYSKDAPGVTSQKWPLVRFSIADGSSRDLLCQREQWNIELPNGEVQASRAQVPLILAWALSIHKAQGQTIDRVKVDLGKIFEKGQAYVALSRATCQEGLQITRFDPKKVMAHDRVRTFYNGLYSVNQAHANLGR